MPLRADPMTARNGTIGDRLRQVRAYFGLNQTDMSARMGVVVRPYQSYEAGKRLPQAEGLQALAGMGVDTNWLLTGAGQMLRDVLPEPPGPLDDRLLEICIETLEAELAAAGRALTPARKAAAVSALYELLLDEEGGMRRPDIKVVRQMIKLAG